MLDAVLTLGLSLAALDYQIVLSNGRIVRVAEAPRIVEQVVVSRLEDGTLVSLPLTRVDLAATRGLTRAVERTPSASGAARPRPRQKVTRTVSNRTIQSYAQGSPARGVPVTGAPSSLTELPGPETPGPDARVRPAIDNNGHGPHYWRERAQVLRDQTRAAERALDVARRSLSAEQDALLYGQVMGSKDSLVKVVRYGLTPEEIALNRLRISQLEEKVREREAMLEEARQREADLQEEARVAGAQPGWIRLPTAYR